MKRFRTLAVAVVIGLMPFAPVRAADVKRPVTAEDLFRINLISSARISHDGTRVAFIVTRLDARANSYHSNIWLVDASATNATQLTRGNHDEDPQWSPDDRVLAFTRTLAKRPQIFRIALGGGEAAQVSLGGAGASEPRWSHDGKRLLFLATTRDEARAAHIDWKAAGTTPKAAQAKTDVRTIAQLRYSLNGVGFTYTRHRHIWVMNADGTGARALTAGHEWSEGNAAWSPDDATLVFTSFRTHTADGGRSDIYTIPAAGGALQRVPLGNRSQSRPEWSHDGTRLWYYLRTKQDSSGLPALANAKSDGSDPKIVVPENTLAFGDAVLTDIKEPGEGCGAIAGPQDRSYVALISTPGSSTLTRIDASSGKADRIAGGDGEVVDCSLSVDGSQVAYTFIDATHLPEIYLGALDGTAPKRLTFLNAALTHELALATPQLQTVKNKTGADVAYWIMRPPNAVEGRKYPTIVDIHGGPHAEFGNSFFHEFQYWAALGYNVVYPNPRGSVGYGYDWASALDGNWGDPMFEDVMAVTDAVAQRPDVDAVKMALMGGSYGGYATLWIIGHTDRFKTAIAERSVSNLFTQQLGFDFAGPADAVRGWGAPWEHPQMYWDQSPLKYVDRVHTPLLLLHSENDIRTPVDQTLQEFYALKMRARPVEYVEFPRENHDLNRIGEPIHRIERLHIFAKWLAHYLQ